MARRLAEQRQIRLQGKGTGIYGSITSKDLDALAATVGSAPAAGTRTPSAAAAAAPPPPPPPSAGPYTDIPLTNVRSVIAKRLLQSKTTIPHYYLTVDVCVDKLLALRKKMNDKMAKDGVKISVNDFIIKAVAMASLKVPEANSAWMDTFIRK